jgi:hypothetical protein
MQFLATTSDSDYGDEVVLFFCDYYTLRIQQTKWASHS